MRFYDEVLRYSIFVLLYWLCNQSFASPFTIAKHKEEVKFLTLQRDT